MQLKDALAEIERLKEELRDIRHRLEGAPFAPAVAMGSIGGQARSPRKVAAARANLRKANAARKNSQKGGWPKGKRRKGKSRRPLAHG